MNGSRVNLVVRWCALSAIQPFGTINVNKLEYWKLSTKARSLTLDSAMDIGKIVDAMWDALDAAQDDLHIGVRGDDASVKTKFRHSYNRPDGRKTSRLPGVSVIYVGYNQLTKEALHSAVLRAQKYGTHLYLLEGHSPTDLQNQFANDPYERIFTSHKILFSTAWTVYYNPLLERWKWKRLKPLVVKINSKLN